MLILFTIEQYPSCCHIALLAIEMFNVGAHKTKSLYFFISSKGQPTLVFPKKIKIILCYK